MADISRDWSDLLRHSRRVVPPKFDDPALPEHYPPDLELEPIHIDIDLYISILARSAGGRVTTTVRARQAGPRELVLDAVDFDDLAIRDPAGRAVTWHYDGKKLRINWDEPFSAGETRAVEVAYRVVQPQAGLYFAAPDDQYPNQAAYMASDHETERARHWLPCIDQPSVRTTLDFHLRADARNTILANGALIEEVDHGDGTKTAHWRLEQPCPSYLIAIAIGELVKADDGVLQQHGRSIPVAYFGGPEHSEEDLLRTFAPTKAMLAWMTELFGLPFPYPKYYQFALPILTGAMENISLVSWSDTAVQDHALAAERSWFIDRVNVHEMAHSYFGDAVVCRDFAHAWLKESWATYIEIAWQEAAEDADHADYVYFLHAQEYFRETEEYKRPIVTRRFQSSWDLYDAHLYEGGACRLHMLRHMLGPDTFWAAVRDYLARYQHQVVETDDLRRVLEEHSGRSLGQFFDQWFRSPGFPDLKVDFSYDATRHEGTFTIEQKQVDAEKGIPAFTFQTEVGWTIGNETFVRSIHVHEPRHVVVVPMADEPTSVRFDPANRVLHRLEFNPGDPMLRRQLTGAPDVIGRIQAAKQLVETGKQANIQAVVDAFHQERFWGVRCEFAKLLGEAGHATAIEGLALQLGIETEPRVLIELLKAAAKYRDAKLARAVQERLAAGLHPEATQAAYRALGAQRDQAPLALLAQTAQAPQAAWRARRGALAGLGESRQSEAAAIIAPLIQYGAAPHRVRDAALDALASVGRGQERRAREAIVEQLSDALRDPLLSTRMAAARALGKLGAPEAIPALEKFRRPLSVQDQAEVDRIIAALRSADKLDGSALKKEVEDLRTRVRALQEELQTLAARVNIERDLV